MMSPTTLVYQVKCIFYLAFSHYIGLVHVVIRGDNNPEVQIQMQSVQTILEKFLNDRLSKVTSFTVEIVLCNQVCVLSTSFSGITEVVRKGQGHATT